MEDIYVASESVRNQSANKQAKRSRAPSEEPLRDFSWPLQEEEFVITLQEDGWNLGSMQSYDPQQDTMDLRNRQDVFWITPSFSSVWRSPPVLKSRPNH